MIKYKGKIYHNAVDLYKDIKDSNAWLNLNLKWNVIKFAYLTDGINAYKIALKETTINGIKVFITTFEYDSFKEVMQVSLFYHAQIFEDTLGYLICEGFKLSQDVTIIKELYDYLKS